MSAPFIKKSLKKITPVYKVYKFFIDWKNREEEVPAPPDILTKRNEISAISDE